MRMDSSDNLPDLTAVLSKSKAPLIGVIILFMLAVMGFQAFYTVENIG